MGSGHCGQLGRSAARHVMKAAELDPVAATIQHLQIMVNLAPALTRKQNHAPFEIVQASLQTY